jgi:energy-coupling factor transporter ATP-binding protein EcfA2
MLINFEDQLNKLKKVRSGQIKEGLKLGIKEIDEHFRFKHGNFNVILGHANVGKTTVILYLMLLYTIKHKTRWLVFSSENEPYSLIRKLVEFIEGKPINKIEEDAFNAKISYINDHFKFVDPNDLYTYKRVLELAQYVKDAWDYDGLMIDPYNSLMKDKDVLRGLSGHEYDYQATSEMRIFCKKNNISIWLNTHAATEALRKKHGNTEHYAGHPIPPMASDVEGGGKFVNRADDFIVIHRYIQHPTDWMYSHIHVRKVKDIDTGGRPTSLEDPIRLRSIINNVGFEVNHKNLIQYASKEQVKLPF